MVLVPAGDFVSGTIHLKSNITLSFAHGARLLGTCDAVLPQSPLSRLSKDLPIDDSFKNGLDVERQIRFAPLVGMKRDVPRF